MNATLDEGTREAGEEAGVVNAEMGGVEETVTEKVADSNQAEQTVKEVELGVAALDDSPVLDIRNDAPSSEDMEHEKSSQSVKLFPSLSIPSEQVSTVTSHMANTWSPPRTGSGMM